MSSSKNQMQRPTVKVNGAVPFVGVMEISVHWSTQPYWDIGPLSTTAETPSCGEKVTLAQFGVELAGMTV